MIIKNKYEEMLYETISCWKDIFEAQLKRQVEILGKVRTLLYDRFGRPIPRQVKYDNQGTNIEVPLKWEEKQERIRQE